MNTKLPVVLLSFLISASALAAPTCQPLPAVQAVLDIVKAHGNALDQLTEASVPKLRAKRDDDAKKVIQEIPVSKVSNVDVPGDDHSIPVRIYQPNVASGQSVAAKLPVLVFIHGGGWTLGSLDTYDSMTRELAAKTPAVVVSIGYRLAPEHPYPAGLNDVEAALAWIAKNIEKYSGNPYRIALAGDSGGANLATVVARHPEKNRSYAGF